MKRRLLSAFLAVMMVLTMAPVAFAAEGETTAVAKIGDAMYSTLADAVANANTGDTIVMRADTDISANGLSIASDKDITLDLNGYEVKAANTGAGNIKVYGKLTLKDSTDTSANGEGQGKITTVTKTYIRNQADQPIIYAVNGDFVMQSGLIDTATGITNNSNDGQFGVGVQNETADASVTIEGGKIKAGWYAVSGNGQMKNHNGNITVNGGILESTTDYAIYNPQQGTTTINGGVIYGQAGGIAINRGSLVVNDGMITSKGIGNTGSWGDGTGNLNNAAIHANANYGDVTVSVKGGKVIAEGDAVTIARGTNYTATVSVSGGTFSSDVSEYCEKDYYTEKNEDNTYSVKSMKDVAVARIGDTYYKSLVDAYAALPRGNGSAPSEPTTITLLKDSEGGGIGSDKTDNYMNYVIDFNGHTYTVGAPAVGSTGTVSQGIRVLKTSTAKFMNGTLKAANYDQLIQVVHTYGNVTFEDFTIDATEDQYAQIAYEVDNGTLNIKGNSNILAYNGQTGLYVSFWPRGGYTGGTTVNVDTTGKITGKMVYEWDDKANTAEQQTENKAVLNIKNGNFDITNIQTLFTSSLPSNLKVPKIYISSGYFNVDPSAYCVTGKTGVTSDKDGYKYKVGTIEVKGENEIKTDTQEGATQATLSDAIAADKQEDARNVGTSVTPTKLTDTTPITETEKNEALTELVKTNKVELTKDGKIPENTTVTVVKETYLDVTVTGYDTENKTVSMDIAPKYNLIAVAKTGADEKTVTLESAQDAKVGSTEVKVTLPDAFKGQKVYINHNNGANLYVATADKDGKITFTTNGFSPFTFTVTNPGVVAEIGNNAYKSLQDAANAAKDGEEITVVKNDKLDFTFNTTKSVKVKNATGADITVKFNNKNTTVKKDGTETFSYTKTSGGSGSSGGNSSGQTTYKVTTSAVNNGGVNASPSSAEKGATITITLSPDKGYKLDKLTVTDGSGKTVSTVKKSDTVYTFTMPASAVNVGVSYVKADATPSETKFNDVSANDWFASAVDYVTGKGMMNGTADNTFSPKANTTRGMVVTVLYRLENQPSTSAASFTDVASGAYYANAVAWANANGIVSGYGSGKFGPNNKVTREQLAAILYRYAQYKKYDVSGANSLDGYADAQSVSSYAVPALQWANAAGVVTGKSGSKLDPKGNAARAEVAAMLMRFCENVK